jgi:hypothetical protein
LELREVLRLDPDHAEAAKALYVTYVLKSTAGSKTRLDYLRAIGKEDREHIELVQSLGYFPKYVGLQTTMKYEFVSVCGIGGGPTVEFVPAEIVEHARLKE